MYHRLNRCRRALFKPFAFICTTTTLMLSTYFPNFSRRWLICASWLQSMLNLSRRLKRLRQTLFYIHFYRKFTGICTDKCRLSPVLEGGNLWALLRVIECKDHILANNCYTVLPSGLLNMISWIMCLVRQCDLFHLIKIIVYF